MVFIVFACQCSVFRSDYFLRRCSRFPTKKVAGFFGGVFVLRVYGFGTCGNKLQLGLLIRLYFLLFLVDALTPRLACVSPPRVPVAKCIRVPLWFRVLGF